MDSHQKVPCLDDSPTFPLANVDSVETVCFLSLVLHYNNNGGWKCNSVVECLYSIYETLGSGLSTAKQIQTKQNTKNVLTVGPAISKLVLILGMSSRSWCFHLANIYNGWKIFRFRDLSASRALARKQKGMWEKRQRMAKRETQQTVKVGLWGERDNPAHLPCDTVITVMVSFKGPLATAWHHLKREPHWRIT